ncbi:MAG: hypothetical protein HZA32_04405 [Opitutae bacterium]|nr:hypothetical protein [Opitutae bacterium]
MRTAQRFVILGIASSLTAGPIVMACLVEPEFKPPQVAFAPASIIVTVPAPKLRTGALLSPMGWSCGGAVVLPKPPAIDGLVDLFGSVANLRTAMASDRVSFASDEFTVTPPCDLGQLGDPEIPDPTRLRNLLLDDASYDWAGDFFETEEPVFTTKLSFASDARTVVAEIAPKSGTVRILVDTRETGRAKLRLPPPELEALLADVAAGVCR